MTTSLARQLDQLRAVAVDAHKTPSQSGPSILSTTLTGEQLTFLAKEAFQALCSNAPCMQRFKKTIFEGDQDNIEDDSDEEMGSEDEAHSLEDLLFLLSDHVLSKPAQYLLQYLIVKLKIHVTYPEILFFISLPYYKYEVFNRIVGCLPIRKTTSEHEDHPRWIEHFRLACHPATSVGLHRHLACDKGFFKLVSTHMVRLMKVHFPKFGVQEGISYNGMVHCFVTMIVSALNLCNSVSEFQILDLARVAFTGLKCHEPGGEAGNSPREEFYSLSMIILSYLLTRVQFKAKVCTRLLNILKKEVSIETLVLLITLYRSQRQNMKEEKLTILELFLKHTDIVSDLMDNADQKGEEDKQFAKKLQKALGLLLCDVWDVAPITQLVELLKINFEAMMKSQLSSELAGILVTSVTEILAKLTKKLKKSKKSPAKDFGSTAKSLQEGMLLSHRILNLLKKTHTVEFYKQSKFSHQSDIFVMENEDTLPTAEQVNVKRILYDNEFIKDLMNDHQLLPDTWRGSERHRYGRKVIKENLAAVKSMFGQVDPSFLIRHIAPKNLVCLVTRLLLIFEGKPKVIIKILEFSTSSDFQGSKEIKEELDHYNIDIAMLILPLTFSKRTDIQESVLPFLNKLTNMNVDTSPLLSDKKAMTIAGELFQSYVENFDSGYLNSLSELFIKCNIMQEPHQFALIAIGGSECLSKGDCGDEVKKTYGNVLSVLYIAVEKLKLVEDPEMSKLPDNQLYMTARKKGIVLTCLVERMLSSIRSMAKLILDPDVELRLCIFTLELGCALEKLGHQVASELAFEIYKPNEFNPLHLKISSMESFQADRSIPTPLHDEFFGLAQAHCARTMSKALLNSHELLSYIPYVLASLMSPSSSVRKIVMKAVKKMTIRGEATVYSPLIDHLKANYAEIMSSHVNMPDIMLEFGANQENHEQLSKLLLGAINSGSTDALARICPLLTSLGDLESLKKVASFGSGLLASQNSNCLMVVITSFVPSITKHLDDPVCLKFVSDCLGAHNLKILHNNLEKTVPLLTLGRIHRRLRKNRQEAVPDTLFNLMIDLSATCDTSDVLTMARKIVEILPLLTTKQILEKLHRIWGEKLNKDSKAIGGRFSVRSSKVVDVDRNWKLTLFLLEVALPRIYDDSPNVLLSLLKPLGVLIKEALDQTDHHDNSYHIDLMLSSILELMTKAGPKNLSEKSINPELMVRCIRTCHNPNTKATALLILAKSSAANPEYILHNSIPIFTFMGTHFLKIDAKHSFDVACQAIDVIIPHIQSVCLAKGANKLADTSLTILHTFADASLDMPHRHRARTFMYKLLVRLGENEYLWILALLLIRQFDNFKHKKFAPQTTEDKMERLRELFSKFDIKTQIHSVHKLILNLRDDSETLRIVFGGNTTTRNTNPEVEKAMGALKVHTMAVLNYLLTSEVFDNQVLGYLQEVEGSPDEKVVVYRKLEEMLVATIVNTDYFGQLVRQGSARKQLVPCCEKILEAVLSMLPMKAIVQLLSSLMIDQRSSVRRKMLEVFNARLQQSQEQFVDENIIKGLLDPLLDLCSNPDVEPNPLNQQMALLCLRSFGKLAAPSFPTNFIPVCQKLVDKDNLANIENQAVKAATLLCLTELYQSMGPHSVPLLNPFVNWMLKLIDNPAIVQEDTVVLNSLILSVQKCLDNFGGFLNPYFKKFIVSSCRLMKVNYERDDDRMSQVIKIRLRHLCTVVSRSVPSQKLIDLGSECYEELLNEPQHCIVAFSIILKENLSQLDKAQALAVSVPCLKLFQSLFKYRKVEQTTSKVDTVEGHFIDTFLTLMMKLSLDDFKPIFYRLFNLSLGGGDQDDIDSLTTMFHITKSVAEKLKSLFSFICETLIQKTTSIFEQYSKDDFSLMRNLSRASSIKLVNLFQHMLQTLTEVFTHNQVESLLVKNYEDHVNSILSHIEAPLEPEDIGALHAQILECLGQLAASTDDETQWKYLNYQVLLFIRNNNLQVSLFVLDVIDRFLDKKGENYLTVLPDSVPLLAEALEDDDSRIEAKCRKLIKKMETIFGHSVESYFE